MNSFSWWENGKKAGCTNMGCLVSAVGEMFGDCAAYHSMKAYKGASRRYAKKRVVERTHCINCLEPFDTWGDLGRCATQLCPTFQAIEDAAGYKEDFVENVVSWAQNASRYAFLACRTYGRTYERTAAVNSTSRAVLLEDVLMLIKDFNFEAQKVKK